METKVAVYLVMIPLVTSLPLQQSGNSQILGILRQSDVSSSGMIPSYITDLLPEMIAASTMIKSNDVVDTLMAYMPFARKMMAGQSPGGKLTLEQEKLMGFTEKVVPPMMRFVQGISGGSSLNDLPLNAIPDDDFTNVMLKMLPDISEIINGLKAKYGGWPGTHKSLEITNAFMPLARKATLYQAQLEGRQITEEENKYLTFAERVVPSLMEYSQALYNKSVVPGQEHQIEQLVKSAVEDLHRITNTRSSVVPFAGYQLQTSQTAHTPVTNILVPNNVVAYADSSEEQW